MTPDRLAIHISLRNGSWYVVGTGLNGDFVIAGTDPAEPQPSLDDAIQIAHTLLDGLQKQFGKAQA